MRRFSQRSALVTLSEINITPLLDLAFVLLIIFVITTPLLEQSLPLKLPAGGQPSPRVDPRDVRTIEIPVGGPCRLNKVPMNLDDIEKILVRDFNANRNLVVAIRADGHVPYEDVGAVLDRCLRHGITRMDLKTVPIKRQ
jgi:biopolymer transport protein ExbD